MKKLMKKNLEKVWERIDEQFELFLPKQNKGVLNFAKLKDEGEVNLEKLKTAIPLKNLVFPQSETYLKFSNRNKKIKFEVVGTGNESCVIFGARVCDIASLEIFDNVFLREPVDTFYKAHRDNTTIVSLECKEPDSECFCRVFGIDETKEGKKSDVALWDEGDFYLWKSLTEKGNFLTESLGELLEDTEIESVVREKKPMKASEDIDPRKINGTLQEIFDLEELWKNLARKCLACGSCTYVCPTCHCYDIKDYSGNHEGERFRCWDSCMYSDFTLMAHGNSRTDQMQRVRQRFMHKLVYYPNNHKGLYSCVGCGRCIEKCPVNLDILKVIKKLVVKTNEL